MKITFINQCKYDVWMKIDYEEPIVVPSRKTVIIDKKEALLMTILIRRTCESHRIAHKSLYCLFVETSYTVDGITDGDTFFLSHEKIRAAQEIYYDKIFLKSLKKDDIFPSNHVIYAEDKVKKEYKREKLLDILFWNWFIEWTGGVLVLGILGIILTIKFGWRIGVIYFPASYLSLVLFSYFLDVIVKKFFKKCLHFDEKEDFYSYFECDFLNYYYSQSSREPFLGEIETD